MGLPLPAQSQTDRKARRDEFGRWDPRALRVFALSNWTGLDVWRDVQLKSLELPSIYDTMKGKYSSATAFTISWTTDQPTPAPPSAIRRTALTKTSISSNVL